MSKRRIAALSALILVPLAVLGVVLATILSSDDGGKATTTQAAAPVAPPPQPGGQSQSPSYEGPDKSRTPAGRLNAKLKNQRLVPVPNVRVPVFDKGVTPAPLKRKVAPSGNGPLNLADISGTPVVVSLWSSWCVPCRTEARVIQSEWERLSRQDVLFLGLDVQDRDAAARRFRSALNLTYPTARDESGSAARRLGAIGLPETFFISGDSKIVGHITGAASLAQIELGTAAAKDGRPFGAQPGGAQQPLRAQ